MEINLGEEDFIVNVEKYTSTLLKNRKDIKNLIGIIKEYEKVNEFESLAFTSKYICGLMRVVKNAPGLHEINNIEQIKKDLNENIKKGMGQLKEIISSCSVHQRNYFEKKYLSITPQSFNRLSQFFSDLEAVKKYINYQKRVTN